MLIILYPNGTAQKVTPERVFQGSNNVQSVTVQGSFPKQTAMKIAFRLPNAEISTWYPMEYVDVARYWGVEISTWTFTLPYAVTQTAGTVTLSINAITGTAPAGGTTYNGQNLTSYTCAIQVEDSIPGLTPEIQPDDFDRLLVMYQSIASQINQLEILAEQAKQTSDETKQKVDRFLSGVDDSDANQVGTASASIVNGQLKLSYLKGEQGAKGETGANALILWGVNSAPILSTQTWRVN